MYRSNNPTSSITRPRAATSAGTGYSYQPIAFDNQQQPPEQPTINIHDAQGQVINEASTIKARPPVPARANPPSKRAPPPVAPRTYPISTPAPQPEPESAPAPFATKLRPVSQKPRPPVPPRTYPPTSQSTTSVSAITAQINSLQLPARPLPTPKKREGLPHATPQPPLTSPAHQPQRQRAATMPYSPSHAAPPQQMFRPHHLPQQATTITPPVIQQIPPVQNFSLDSQPVVRQVVRPTTLAPQAYQVRAIWDCRADQVGDLEFNAGDIVTVLKKDSSGWWIGQINGRTGQFPANYVNQL